MFKGLSFLPGAYSKRVINYETGVITTGSVDYTSTVRSGAQSDNAKKRPRPSNYRGKRPAPRGKAPSNWLYGLSRKEKLALQAMYSRNRLGTSYYRNVVPIRVAKQSKRLPDSAYSYSQVMSSLYRVFSEETFRPAYVHTLRTESGAYSAQVPATVGFPSGAETRVYNRALDKLYDKIRGNIDLSVDIAEAHQTQRMLSATNRVESLAKTLASRYALLKIPAQLWLEYTYGWKPLLSDIYESALATTEVVINAIDNVSERATEHVQNLPVTFTVVGLNKLVLPSEGSGKVSCTIGMRFRTQKFDIGKFTSLNPISLAWEVLPYSFVVDWFYNVGGYLREMESALLFDSRFVSGYVSQLRRYEGTSQYFASSSSPSIKSSTAYNGSFREVTFSRSLLTAAPRPRLPSFKANLGSYRLTSAASLLSNLLR